MNETNKDDPHAPARTCTHPGQPIARAIAAVLLVVAGGQAWAGVLDVMREELQRSHAVLAEQPTPVYYLSYEITGASPWR